MELKFKDKTTIMCFDKSHEKNLIILHKNEMHLK